MSARRPRGTGPWLRAREPLAARATRVVVGGVDSGGSRRRKIQNRTSQIFCRVVSLGFIIAALK